MWEIVVVAVLGEFLQKERGNIKVRHMEGTWDTWKKERTKEGHVVVYNEDNCQNPQST